MAWLKFLQDPSSFWKLGGRCGLVESKCFRVEVLSSRSLTSRSVNGSQNLNSACCAYFAQKILIQSNFFFRFLDTSTPREFCFVPLIQTISTCWHLFFDILKRIFRSLARIFHSFFDCLTLFFDPSDNFFRPDDTFNFRSLQTFLSICWHPFFSTCWHLSSTSCQNFYRLENTTFRSDDTFIFWFSRPWDTIFSVSW